MKLKTPTKRLDSSHLTQQERRQAIGITTAGLMSIFIGLLELFIAGNKLWALVALIGACALGFCWGRVGTIEDERSSKP